MDFYQTLRLVENEKLIDDEINKMMRTQDDNEIINFISLNKKMSKDEAKKYYEELVKAKGRTK